MADSTASGPLWQQRPYPAPGKILRGRNPTEGEAAGPRQRGEGGGNAVPLSAFE